MKYLRLLFIPILFWGGSAILHANHIVGGDLSYECLGNNNYRITLKVYKDCFAQGPNVADFDNPANITIYRGGSSTIFLNLSEPLDSRQNIAIDLSNPCLIPPNNVCVEEGIYQFDVNLPYDPQGYHISYERCCRNQTISNIPNPGSWGATYTIFISDLAQSSCNDSPVFNNFPPIVICNNQPIDFDHGATDAQGDSLVYYFCAPFHGASQSQPQPPSASSPPYTAVPFNAPTYTASAPLGANITIDPQTGFITGSPTALGQYVVGICVDEYRNGVWLSSTKRDFQFNVTSCQLTLFADIQEDEKIGDKDFVVNNCGDTVITFVNQSGQAQYINAYFWAFNMNGTIATSSATNPTFTFPGWGTYQGILVVNPGAVGCTDTAFIYVNTFPPPDVDFDFAYDSCVIGPVNFFNQTTINTGGGTIDSIVWDFGDDSLSNTNNPVYQYADAGNFDVTLTVFDVNGCTENKTKNLTWAPSPIIDIVPSAQDICAPDTVFFENNSYPINGYSTWWTLGDGGISTEASPTYEYTDPGTYTVSITITSPIGCVSRDTFHDLIRVFDPPTPSFTTAYDSCEYGPVTFTQFSTPGESPIVLWEWLPDDGNIVADTNIVYQYDSAGTYFATLQITDSNGCVRTTDQRIDWYPAPIFQTSSDEYRDCVPFTTQIVNESYPINGYFLLWNLGDGYYSSDASPIHTYEEPGTYTLTLQVTSPTGCYEEQVFPDLVIAEPNPVAAFSISTEEPTNFDPTVAFVDESIDAVSWEWDFGTGVTSTEQNPVYAYPDTGVYQVRLVVTHASGCTDTTYQAVDVVPKFTYFLPNAFTPNDDAVNDGYRGRGELFGINNFEMTIWNRWGEQIFATNNPQESWNGRLNNTGKMVKNGVYICIVKFIGPRGEKIEMKEFATVIR